METAIKREGLSFCLLVLCGFFFLLFLRQMNASRGNCRGKNNLGLGVAVLLQVTDEGIKFHGTWKRHLQHDGIEPCDAVAFQDIGAGCNIRIEFVLLFRIQCQIDKCSDVITQGHRINRCMVAGDNAVLFQAFDARGDGWRR